jgi:lysophospholipase L1-like esterase
MRNCFDVKGFGLGGLAALLLLAGCGSSDGGSSSNQNGGDRDGGLNGSGGSVANGAGGGFVGSGGFVGGSGFTGSGGFVGGSGFTGSGGFVGVGGGNQAGAGNGGSTGTGGTNQGGSGNGTGGQGSGEKPPCISGPTDAAIIGDSYVTGALSPALQPALAALYPTAGQFPNYAVPGTSMATGGITGLIPPQFDTAIAQHPTLKFTIMDGGGNDILICNNTQFPNCATLCKQPGSSTQKVCTDIVTQALAAADALMQKAAAAGVKDVIYFFYPHIPNSNGGYKEILDYSEPLAKAKCDGAFQESGGKLTCHFVSLIKPFADAGGDMNPANFAADGIHPSQAGQNIIAQQIYGVMQSRCLGQEASSGCCAP